MLMLMIGCEALPEHYYPFDTDGDGRADVAYLDTDGDGTPDLDADGQPIMLAGSDKTYQLADTVGGVTNTILGIVASLFGVGWLNQVRITRQLSPVVSNLIFTWQRIRESLRRDGKVGVLQDIDLMASQYQSATTKKTVQTVKYDLKASE
jgi:hypothetical protein